MLARTWLPLIPLLAFAVAAPAARPSETGAAGEAAAQPVLLELFTSQGCSSCPAADRLLSALGNEGLGAEVVPLAFHVDYWNYIGWTDPFSSASWSDRQRAYARVFDPSRIYTPQLVVGGHSEVVGSDEREVRRIVERELARQRPGRVELAVSPLGADRVLEVRVEARLVGDAGGARPELLVALFENRLTTDVPRGENARRTLRNDYVVRSLESVAALGGADAATANETLDLRLDPSWNARNTGVVAFLQDARSLEILGVDVQYPVVAR